MLHACVAQVWDGYASENLYGAFGGDVVAISAYGLYPDPRYGHRDIYRVTFATSTDSITVTGTANSTTTLLVTTPAWGVDLSETNVTMSIDRYRPSSAAGSANGLVFAEEIELTAGGASNVYLMYATQQGVVAYPNGARGGTAVGGQIFEVAARGLKPGRCVCPALCMCRLLWNSLIMCMRPTTRSSNYTLRFVDSAGRSMTVANTSETTTSIFFVTPAWGLEIPASVTTFYLYRDGSGNGMVDSNDAEVSFLTGLEPEDQSFEFVLQWVAYEKQELFGAAGGDVVSFTIPGLFFDLGRDGA